MIHPEATRTFVAAPEAPVMVEAVGISKKFLSFQALDRVSFRLRKGEILGLLGPNGAGKTTAMRILAGYFPPSRGKVYIGGKELGKAPEKAKSRIGYLPESIELYRDMQVRELLDFVGRIKERNRKKRKQAIEEKMERCGLWQVRKRLIGQLSKGFRQRLGLAQALLGEPEVLLLDEPTSGLDPKQIKEIRSLIRELGKERTLILSTHILPEVSMVCDRVLILNEGRVAAEGTAEELEAGLRTRYEIFVTAGDRHRKEEAARLLGGISGVESVSILEEHGDRVDFCLTVSKGVELRPVISRLFVEHKIPLFEIRSGRLSLEDIFLKLVVREPAF